MADVSKAVLITGCSSGIGRATAQRLAAAGWPVWATARRREPIAELEAAGCRLLELDVDDEESMQAAVATVSQEHGAVGVLINNAGYGLQGPIETTPMAEVRAQFETNVFGLIRLTQLVLPGMRRQEWGRVVNLSSMGGRITLPGGGFYHATKHAVEALSDALRLEVTPFGIKVVVIEPGPVKTAFADTTKGTIGAGAIAAGVAGPYADFETRLAARITQAYEGREARLVSSADDVAKVIEKAISARSPRTRYVVGAVARAATLGKRALPDRAFDAALRRTYPTP